jgi:DNA-binding transcriptional LysR family regulator
MFLQVAHARSYHRAAEQLDLSHPTVSRAVMRLEKALGVRLVDEATARGVTLTEVGARLAREIAAFDIGLADVLRSIVPNEAEPVQTTLPPTALAALDTWIASQPEPRPSRSDAVTLAVADWLTGLGLLRHRDDPEGANGRHL